MGVSRRQVPPHLYRRYGIKSRTSNWLGGLVAGLSIAATLVALALVGRGLGSGGDTKLIRWTVGREAVELTWSVLRYDNQPVYCVLRAQDSERFDVGFAVVRVADTDQNPQLTSKLAVRSGVYSVVPPDCAPAADHLPTPSFRPGLLPPAQQPPLAAPWQPLPAPVTS